MWKWVRENPGDAALSAIIPAMVGLMFGYLLARVFLPIW